MTFYGFIGDIKVSEEYATSLFRIEMCRGRNRLGNIAKL
jgi:hypothetical protein